MATGKYVSDLEQGDRLGPIDYTLSSFVIREYAHTVEMHQPCFQDGESIVMPPTLVHLDKLRLYRHACPMGTGPDARIHFEYDCEVFMPIPAGTELSVSGFVSRRYEKKGRTYVDLTIDLNRRSDGALMIRYRDTVILSFRQSEAA
jgi:hypothetical protein